MTLVLLLLTPILVLGIVALFGFVGCYTPVSVNFPVIDSLNPVSGPSKGGTLVTVKGENFESDTTINFDTTPATSVTVLDQNTLTAITPAHAPGTVDVTTLTGGRFEDTAHQAFTYFGVTQLVTVPSQVGAGATQVSVTLTDPTSDSPNPDKLVVVAMEWDGPGNVALSGATFQQRESDVLTPQKVAIFYATQVALPATVVATLSAPTTTAANLFASAYAGAAAGDPSPFTATQGVGTDATLPLQTSSASPSDLVYSFVVARGPGSALAGTLSPGTAPAFTAEAGQGSPLMVQDYLLDDPDIAAGQISVTATNTSGQANSKWYIFGMRIPHA